MCVDDMVIDLINEIDTCVEHLLQDDKVVDNKDFWEEKYNKNILEIRKIFVDKVNKSVL